MNTAELSIASPDIVHRINSLDWEHALSELDSQGNCRIERLLSPNECQAIASLYDREHMFRSRVVMSRHGFGRGEYKYFSYPLPDLIADLRAIVYPYLVPIANGWNKAMGIDVQYPLKHEDFIERCHRARSGPHHSFSGMEPVITTACTRTFTESMCSRCNWQYCYRNPARISRAANSS